MVLPENARVAVLQAPSTAFTRRYPYYTRHQDDALNTREAYLDTLRAWLYPSGVQEAELLPSLLVPDQPSIPLLREIAVRLQADALLVFRVYGDLMQQYRVFSSDQFKAYATCEAILLDVRTGAIPFTTVVTREYRTRKQRKDLSDQDAQHRAEQ